MYHVFLSHSSVDKAAVEQLALRLRHQAGLNPFLDKWHLVPGASWQPALEQAIADSETVAVFFGPSGPAPWRNEELQLALVRAVQQRNDFRVIPVLLPGATPEQVGGFLGLRTWVDFREGLDNEAAFGRLVAGIQGRAPAGDAFNLPDEPAPYRGLLAFDEAYSEYFFGRNADIERTLEKLSQERFVAVVGASGCGKSSLVLGGVLPQVKQPGGILGSGVRVWTMRPGDRPLRALANALAAAEASGAQRLALSDALHKRFLEQPDGLRTALATLTADRPGPCLLVVDQLEELFTHAPAHGGTGEIEPFVSNLRNAVLDGSGSVRILATLRADFFDRCLSVGALRELLQDRNVLLGSLGEEGLRDVILRPAQKVGAYLEKGLLTAILRDVSREPGALPLLEDALDQLWRARSGAWLTLSAYEASGGISQALQRRAQASYEALSPEEREVARRLLVRLTSLGEGREDTRRRVPRSELVFPGIPEERVEHVLQALSAPGARLIVVDQGSVEVAHEVLIRTWSTLRKWLDEDRRELRVQRRLAEAAGEWNEKGRQAGYLYTGARLLDAEELFKRKPSLLNQLEREFLEASIQQRDEQRREEEEQAKRELESARRLAEETEARRKVEAEGAASARRSAHQLRNLVVGLAMAVAVVIAGSFQLYRQFQRAENEKRVALSRELTLSARQNLREDPQRSLLLLQEAHRLAPVNNLGEQLDTWSQEPSLLVLRGHEKSILAATFSPDGTRVLTASMDGTARVWETSSGKSLATLQGHPDGWTAATFSPDGMRVLTTSSDGTLGVWEVSAGKLLATLQPGDVSLATFSPDGTRVLTLHRYSGTGQLWEASTGKLLPALTLEGYADAVRSATFSRDGKLVLTACDDGTARLWEASTGKFLRIFEKHSELVWAATFSPDGKYVLTASADDTARVWEISSGKALATLKEHTDDVISATFSPDGTRVLTASPDGTARVWEALSGKQIYSVQGHTHDVISAGYDPGGTRIATVSRSGTVHLWDASTGKIVGTLQGHSENGLSATFSPDGTRVLTASEDGTARLWEASMGKPLATFQGHRPGGFSAKFSPDGTRVLTASEDGAARLWAVSTGKPLATLQGHSRWVDSATFSSDDTRVLTASRDGTARLWEASTGKLLHTLQGHPDEVISATFNSDDKRVLTASKDGTVHLWEASTGKLLETLPEHSAGLLSATLSPDGTRILTAAWDGDARLWEASTGKLLTTLKRHPQDRLSLHPDHKLSAVFSPDGTRVLTTCSDDTVRLWEASTGNPLIAFPEDLAGLLSAMFSSDGTRVLTASRDGTARLWDASTGKLLTHLSTGSGWMESARLSPDGTRVLTVIAEGKAQLWEASTGKFLIELQGHSPLVQSTTFSPEGTLVLSTFKDGTARLWEASTGKPLATLQGHSGWVGSATFSSDGTRVLTTSEDGTVHLWPSWRWDPEAFEKLDVGRTLTCEERLMYLHEDRTCSKDPVPTVVRMASAQAVIAP